MPLDLPPCVLDLDLEERGGRPAMVGSVLSDERPIRVHWETAEDEAMAQAVLPLLEQAWDVQVDDLGFRAPVLPDAADGPELDVYVMALGDGEAGVEADGLEDDTPGDGFRGTSSWIALDSGLSTAALPAFVAHEFNHVLHWATDFEEESINLWEATATAAQAWTLGDGDWAADVPDFQEAPWAPALLGDSYVLWDQFEVGWAYEYGAALWMMHLADVHGDDVGARIWNDAADEGDPPRDFLDAVVELEGSLAGAMNWIAARRWFVGNRWDDRGLDAAEGWGAEFEVPVAARIEAAPAEVSFDPGLRVTGQGFVEVDLGSGEDGDRVFFRVASELGLDSALIVWPAGGGEHHALGGEPVELARTTGPWSLAVTNLGMDGFDATDDPWVAGDQILSVTVRPDFALPDPGQSCDCSAGGGSAGWLLGLLALRRRRTRR